MRTALVAAAVVVAAGSVAVLSRAGGADDPPGLDRAHSTYDVERVRRFAEYPLYWLGGSFAGLPLRAVTRRDDAAVAGERVRGDYVGFIYGDCIAHDEMACAPPLEVQVWPACERSLADYMLTPAGEPVPHEATVVRGVPGAYFEEGLRLELYTGTATIVIFGLERNHLMHAAAALRAANALASDARMLPPPARGALAGTLSCGA